MKVDFNGNLVVVSTNQVLNFALEVDTIESFCASDNIEKIEFDYGAIFTAVCEALKKENYEVPMSKEAFNKSPLWAHLGFEMVDEFELVRIEKHIRLSYYTTYGEDASYIVDFKKETIHYPVACEYRNNLDGILFDLPVYTRFGEEVNGSDVLSDLSEFFSLFESYGMCKEELFTKTKEYYLNLKDEDGNERDESELEAVLKLLNQTCEEMS